MKKLPEKDVPEVWRELAEASTRRLVRAEARSVVAMRTEARRVHAELLGHLASVGGRLAAIAAVKHATSVMQGAIAAQILQTRSRAREAALEQAQAELNRLAAELRAAERGKDVSFGRLAKASPTEDEAHADAVSRSFAARWAQTVLALIVAAPDDDPNVQARARLVMQKLDKRIGVIAATESAKAFSDQHASAVDQALGDPDDELGGDPAAQVERRSWLPLVLKRWNAILDRKTCEVCWKHDGEIVPLGMDFDDGDEPGHVHACCRCVPGILLLPIPLSEREDVEDLEDDEDAA